MPLYDFICADCEHEFELICSHDATPHCKACDSENAMRQVSFPSGYSIRGDNSASVTPRRFGGHETDKKLAKKERINAMVQKQLKDV